MSWASPRDAPGRAVEGDDAGPDLSDVDALVVGVADLVLVPLVVAPKDPPGPRVESDDARALGPLDAVGRLRLRRRARCNDETSCRECPDDSSPPHHSNSRVRRAAL